ncbi:MAG TPA: alpha-amylase family glycosyl hydrolase [Dongiaceae bacterium]|nr:alpha-amylase family glycosyl hydrolase [Dongiaceae bacterium]
MTRTHPLLYEINTRCWLRRLAEERGGPVTLASVPPAQFEQWRRLGFTHIWLMGAWTSGPRARQQALAQPRQRRLYGEVLPGWQAGDVAGSPYAIGDYRVPAALGGEAGLAEFRNTLQAYGLKLLLDFVPNHLGLDHPWLTERPDLFVQSPKPRPGTFRQETTRGPRWLAHGKDPHFLPWTDTVQLDYRRPDTRAAMTGLLESIACRCDGARCDMAMLLLEDVFSRTWEQFPAADPAPGSEFWADANAARGAGFQPANPRGPGSEFWADAIAAVKRTSPDFLFLAEAYWGLEPRLQALGFDYTYDKLLYDQVIARDAAGAQRHLLGSPPQGLAAGAHFLENHDEPRAASLLSLPEQGAAAFLILGLPGMRFLHQGQLSGARIHLPVQLLRCPAEPKQPAIQALYERLLTTLLATSVGRGQGELLPPRAAWPDNPTAQNFVLAQWQAQPPEFDLVAVNLAPHPSQCYAPLNPPGLAARQWRLDDLLARQHFLRDGPDLHRRGLYLDLPAHGTSLLHAQPA